MASQTFEDHLHHIEATFQRLRAANLKLKPSKCIFAVKEVEFLGHNLSCDGVSPSKDKVEAIKSFPIPKTVKQMRSWLGLSGFYRKFIPKYAEIAKPLYSLTKKNVPFNWNSECQSSFDKLKSNIIENAVLQYPDFGKPFILATDASDIAISGTLSQRDENGVLRPVSFAGRSLSDVETRYDTTSKEILAIIWSFTHFKVYLEGSKFQLYTDHAPLKFILGPKENLPSKLYRYALFMQGFEFDVHHIKGLKNIVPDVLSRRQYEANRTREDDVIDAYPDLSSLFDENTYKIIDTPLPTNHTLNKYVVFDDTPNFIYYDEFAPVSEKLLPCSEIKVDINPILKCPTTLFSIRTTGNIPHKTPKPNRAPVPKKCQTVKSIKRKQKYRAQLNITSQKVFDTINLTPEAVRDAQNNDKECKPLIIFLKHNILPTDDTKAREILLRQEDYVLINDLLYHIFTPIGHKRESASAQLVIPQNFKSVILQLNHDSSLGGHLGASKMLSVMRPKYFLAGIYKRCY